MPDFDDFIQSKKYKEVNVFLKDIKNERVYIHPQLLFRCSDSLENFKKYQELTFYKKVGNVPTNSNSNWHYQTAKDSAGNIIYVASSEDASEHYISVDGVGWYQFTLQSSGNTIEYLHGDCWF